MPSRWSVSDLAGILLNPRHRKDRPNVLVSAYELLTSALRLRLSHRDLFPSSLSLCVCSQSPSWKWFVVPAMRSRKAPSSSLDASSSSTSAQSRDRRRKRLRSFCRNGVRVGSFFALLGGTLMVLQFKYLFARTPQPMTTFFWKAIPNQDHNQLQEDNNNDIKSNSQNIPKKIADRANTGADKSSNPESRHGRKSKDTREMADMIVPRESTDTSHANSDKRAHANDSGEKNKPISPRLRRRPIPEKQSVVVSHEKSTPETLLLKTSYGNIRIQLRPDFGSPESVDYVRHVATRISSEHQTPPKCKVCNLYRAEKPGILQGILQAPSHIPLPTQRGQCPPGMETIPNNCPAWDAQCACHGPVMRHGYVGWAAGKTGPDFFMDTYVRPAQWWGTQHTVWGEITDPDSFEIIRNIYELPVVDKGGLHHLQKPIHFDLELETIPTAAVITTR